MRPPDPHTLIATQWPVEGPHTPELLTAACGALAELVRYAVAAGYADTLAGAVGLARDRISQLYHQDAGGHAGSGEGW